MKARNYFLLMFISILISACATSPNVYTDFDPEQDFSKYSSFSWTSSDPVIINSETPVSPLVVDRLKRSVKSSMEQKGYMYIEDRENADIAITLTVGARDKIEVRQEPSIMFNTNWRWGNRYWVGLNAPITSDRTIQYEEGTLAIDVFDVKREAPVWHGVSEKRLRGEERAGEATFIQQAVETTLLSFPTKGNNLIVESKNK